MLKITTILDNRQGDPIRHCKNKNNLQYCLQLLSSLSDEFNGFIGLFLDWTAD
jgi:hypothetical protein